MSNTSSIFAVFSVLVGVMLFGIWSNIHAYAQQSSSPTLSASSPPTGDSLSTTTISPELKAKICDPSNPSLKVVNTTESHICGIPKTIKPPSLSASPPISTVSSSTQKTTIKPTPAASVAAPKQQQQQIATTNNNTVSRSTGGATGATMAPVSNPINRSLSTSPSNIAPQVNAISQQQQQQQQPVTGINSTAGQNYTLAATSPVVTSDKLLYLGYHGTTSPAHGSSGPKDKSSSSDTKPRTHHSTRSISDSSPKDKHSSDTKPSTPHIRISATDNDSREKKTKTSTTKLDRTDSINDDSGSKHKSGSSATESSSHTDDGSESRSSDLASGIKNKVDSIIRNTLGEVRHNLFGFSDDDGF
jgi:hypothetical protein